MHISTYMCVCVCVNNLKMFTDKTSILIFMITTELHEVLTTMVNNSFLHVL
jgi:hypothetical protein